MKTDRYLIIIFVGLLATGLLAACSSPTPSASGSATVTAVPPTATTETSTADQQAADTVSRFLQSLLDDSSGTSSLDDLSQPLQATVESGNLLTTLLGIGNIDQMYRSFGVETLQVDPTRGQAIVEAGLNYVSPVKRDFVMTEEAGNWLINTILSYSMPSMSLPEDRLDSAQVIIDYYQALEDKQINKAMALLSPLNVQNNETDVTQAAKEIQGITVTSLDLLHASADLEVYSATFWVLPDSEDSGNWTSGSNMRRIELTHTADGWRIAQVIDNSIATPVPTPLPTTTTAACTLVANSDIPLYYRPAVSSGEFGTLTAGEKVVPGGQTTTGWLGFDPAVAQAANMGIFRLRWLAPRSDISLSGSCDTLPVYPEISPTACYEMAMADTPIYDQPMDTAATIATLAAGSYTAVTGKSDQGWFQVNLGDGSLAGSHSGQTGWIAPDAGNFNGQSCSNLPVVNP